MDLSILQVGKMIKPKNILFNMHQFLKLETKQTLF